MAPRNRTTDEAPDEVAEEVSEDETPDEPVVEDANGNGSYVPSRAAIAADGEVPARTRRSSDYSAWANEIEALATTALGQAFSYEDVPNVSGLAQGLKRVYGVHAEVRDIITAKMVKNDETLAPRKGYGTLWITYKPMIGANGQLDADKVAEQKAEYTK